jgi:hypothetical protein
MNYEGRDIYCYMQFVLYMKISIVILFIHNLICQTRVVIIIMVTSRVSLDLFGLN